MDKVNNVFNIWNNEATNHKPKRVPIALEKTQKENLKVGVRSNGTKYTVRDNRDKFFFPNEWNNFFNTLKNNQKLTFDVLINTGARINEVINVRVGDIDFDRNNIILRVTKTKAKKGEKNPRPRTISISTQFSKKLRRYLKGKNNDEKIGLLSKPAAHIAMKKGMERAGVKEWWMFSIHNIRKTHGNWLKALGIDGAEICTRLGHDYNTFLRSYSSPNIFNDNDKRTMRSILGDLYFR